MERQAPQALIAIHEDIARAAQEPKLTPLEYFKIKHEHSSRLFDKALGVLNRYGVDNPKILSGQRVSVRETPAVQVEINGEEVQLAISEDFTHHLGERYTKDKIDLVYTNSDLRRRNKKQVIFSVGDGGSQPKNWLYTYEDFHATLTQMEMVSEVLSFMEESLSESSTPITEQPSTDSATDAINVPWGGEVNSRGEVKLPLAR